MGIIRKTPAIAAILNEFNSNQHAISAITLIKRLEHMVNKTTVYRVLDRLEDEGMLHSFLDKDGIKWYAQCHDCSSEGHSDIHPHFQCLDCGTVDCLDIEVPIPQIPKRQVSVSQVLIQGRCEACAS